MSYLLAPFALLLGVVLATQVATNTELGKALDNPYIPAVMNMMVGVVLTIALTLFMTEKWPTGEAARNAPWYGWVAGGLLGTTYLTGAILLAPKLGVAALIGLVVTGQLIFSVLLDHFGWFGFEQHAAGFARIAGCLLMIGGVFLISKF